MGSSESCPVSLSYLKLDLPGSYSYFSIRKPFKKIVLCNGALCDNHRGLPWVYFMHWGNLQVAKFFRERSLQERREVKNCLGLYGQVYKWLCFLCCNTMPEVRA